MASLTRRIKDGDRYGFPVLHVEFVPKSPCRALRGSRRMRERRVMKFGRKT